MGNIVEFTGKTAEERTAEGESWVVAVLADALELAREGKLSAVAIAWVNDDGSTSDVWANPWRQHALTASIAYLQARYSLTEINRERDNEGN